MDKMKVKLGKPLSAGAVIVLVFMILFGIGFAVLVVNVLIENDAPPVMKIIFPLFIVGWIGAAVYMLVYHALNLKREKGMSFLDIETDTGPMQRLRDLEALRKDGLISGEEYSRKRAEIMEKKW